MCLMCTQRPELGEPYIRMARVIHAFYHRRKCAEAAEEIEYDESEWHDEDEDDEDEDDDDEGDEPIDSAKRANGKGEC